MEDGNIAYLVLSDFYQAYAGYFFIQ